MRSSSSDDTALLVIGRFLLVTGILISLIFFRPPTKNVLFALVVRIKCHMILISSSRYFEQLTQFDFFLFYEMNTPLNDGKADILIRSYLKCTFEKYLSSCRSHKLVVNKSNFIFFFRQLSIEQIIFAIYVFQLSLRLWIFFL